MNFNKKNYSNKLLISLYYQLQKSRLIEEKMLKSLRTGFISKWFSGIGQEAVSVGATMALDEDEYVLPMHRNLGVFTSRNMPLDRLFAQFQGKETGYTKGRDRSFHFGSQEHHIIGMISHLGSQLAVADGIALAESLAKEKKVTLVFTGDGGTSEGDFHEALNVAAVWDLPVIFLVENNGFSISTPVSEQYKIKSFTEKGPAYGIEVESIDGNNVLEVYDTIKRVSRSIKKNPRPVMIEAVTFRMRGHEESSGVDYVPEELFELWAEKDPIENYEAFLLDSNILNNEKIEGIFEEITNEIDGAVNAVQAVDIPDYQIAIEEGDVYADHDFIETKPSSSKQEMRFVDAIKNSLDMNLDRFDNLILMGQDIAEYGGVFKVTEGLAKKYGKSRVRNTPLCESAILGSSLGLCIAGYKSVIEMQFADFVTCGFNQIVNNLAKSNYRWGQNADVVVRMPSGGGMGAGPFHSQSPEAWFHNVPGLKIVYPSNPTDAKGLLNTAVADPNPVLFFEHKQLYRSLTEEVPVDYYTLPIGKGAVVKEGEDASIVTYGNGVHWAKSILKEFPDYNIEIIDLRSILPWDKEIVEATIKKTGRVLLLSEDNLTGGFISEVSAWIMENLFQSLDCPVLRCASDDTPIPFSKNLEEGYLAKSKLKSRLEELLDY